MKCEMCGSENPDDAVYCNQCGSQIGEASKTIPLKIYVPKETHDQLILYVLDENMARLTIKLDKAVFIGRSDDTSPEPPEVDLAPYDAKTKGVSRRHAQLRPGDGSVFVEDLDSLNGTYLNGNRLAPHAPHILRSGDEIRLGNLRTVIHFQA